MYVCIVSYIKPLKVVNFCVYISLKQNTGLYIYLHGGEAILIQLLLV